MLDAIATYYVVAIIIILVLDILRRLNPYD